MHRRTIGELAESGSLVFSDGYRTKRSELGEPGYRILRVADVDDWSVAITGPDFVSQDRSYAMRSKLSRPGDVLLTTKGTVGRVAIYPDVAEQVVYSPQLCYFRVLDPEKVNPRYLAYWFKSPSFARQALHRANNTDMAPYINMRDIRSLEVDLPGVGTQRAIAEVLGALDDKIAANDRTLQLTDELVRARFESLAGDPVPLSQVAINWRRQVEPDEVDPETPYIGLEHVPRRRMWLTESDIASVATSAKSAFAEGDVLFGKLRPYFHKVVRAPFGGICSTDILVVRAKDPNLAGFVLAAASSDRAVREATAASEGTRMPRTKWADLGAVEVAWPGETEALAFSQAVSEIGKLAGSLADESRCLGRTRDELLPLLMSGRVRVSDAEKMAEEVL